MEMQFKKRPNAGFYTFEHCRQLKTGLEIRVLAGVYKHPTTGERTMAVIDFGGTKETIAIVGYGVQGPAQALNPRD
jgi:hypothetical protein